MHGQCSALWRTADAPLPRAGLGRAARLAGRAAPAALVVVASPGRQQP
jgi:hypothetical protein